VDLAAGCAVAIWDNQYGMGYNGSNLVVVVVVVVVGR